MSDTVVNLPVQPQPRREVQNVIDPVAILDTSRFEHMQRVANVLARSSMIPATLREEGTRDNKQPLPFEQIMSNCFLVVNQAARWGMDPFSVLSCCSVVHGRLSYEGKLVAAVLDAKLSIKPHYHFTGDPATEAYRVYVSDKPFTDELIASLEPGVNLPGFRLWDGSVAEWKTTGNNSPWSQKNYRRMLIYRGTRDWTRVYEPAIMLGVYTDDELDDLVDDARARRATNVTPSTLMERLSASPKGNEGFSVQHVEAETSETPKEPEVQREAQVNALPDAPSDDEPRASVQEPLSSGSGAVQDRSESTAPPISDSSQANPGSSPTETDEPASDAPETTDAGDNSPAASEQPLPSELSPDWQDTYLLAMGRVNERPRSLPNRHNEAIQLIGGKANAEEKEWMTAVYRLTERRLRGEITKDECDAAIREIAG